MNQERFLRGVAQLGGNVSETQLEQYSAYAKMLRTWNEKMNLTAITDPDGIAIKHFLDSILPLYYTEIPQGAKVIDVGTGAGFPGIPLKIMRPDLEITLVDSLQKRVRFLEEVCKTLSITQVSCVHGRAEELGKDKKYREQFDVLVSRAVANLTVLGEYGLPFVKVGGTMIALKAEEIEAELQEARPMLGTLGGKPSVLKAPLPESDMIRKLVVIEKVRATPTQFPRRANQIKRK